MTPQAMLPWIMNPIPPNIFISVSPEVLSKMARIRVARFSSYATSPSFIRLQFTTLIAMLILPDLGKLHRRANEVLFLLPLPRDILMLEYTSAHSAKRLYFDGTRDFHERNYRFETGDFTLVKFD
jgi:hypothetical protein